MTATGWWFFSGTPVSPINITDHQDITSILLKVALYTINLNQFYALVTIGTIITAFLTQPLFIEVSIPSQTNEWTYICVCLFIYDLQ